MLPSLAFHAALPLLFWGLHQLRPEAVGVVFLAIHFGVPVLLVATYRWWRAFWEGLALLVVANHLVTFSVIALLLATCAP